MTDATQPSPPLDPAQAGGSPPNSGLGDTKPGSDVAPLPNTAKDTASAAAAAASKEGTTEPTSANGNNPLGTFPTLPPRRQNSGLPGAGDGSAARASTNCTLAAPFVPGPSNAPDPYAGKTIYDFQVLDCNHELYDLGQHKGEVLLICNVASKSKEYSEQGYKTLVTLYNKYRNRGFCVIAMPCNQFGGCETGNEDEIAENIPLLYNGVGEIEFPIMAKVDVNGDHELPLYGFLKARVKGTLGQSAVKWNFTSFLVDREGNPIVRFAPGATTEEIEPRLQEALDGCDAGSFAAPPLDARTREPSQSDIGTASTPQPPPPQSVQPAAKSTDRDDDDGTPADATSSVEGGAPTASPGTMPSLGTPVSPDAEDPTPLP